MSNLYEPPAARGGFLPIVLTVGGFFLFFAVIAFVWFDRRPPAVARGGLPPEQRLEMLNEQKAAEQERLTQYGWVDEEKGVVRLPVERAMELVLEEINQGQTRN